MKNEVTTLAGSDKPTKFLEPTKLLKLKSIFYRYTGWYLADKEEAEYLKSKGFDDEVKRMTPFNEENEMNDEDLKGLLIGCWQADHGFARPWVRFKYLWKFKYPKLYPVIALINWFLTLFTVIKWDLEKLYRKLFK